MVEKQQQQQTVTTHHIGHEVCRVQCVQIRDHPSRSEHASAQILVRNMNKYSELSVFLYASFYCNCHTFHILVQPKTKNKKVSFISLFSFLALKWQTIPDHHRRIVSGQDKVLGIYFVFESTQNQNLESKRFVLLALIFNRIIIKIQHIHKKAYVLRSLTCLPIIETRCGRERWGSIREGEFCQFLTHLRNERNTNKGPSPLSIAPIFSNLFCFDVLQKETCKRTKTPNGKLTQYSIVHIILFIGQHSYQLMYNG